MNILAVKTTYEQEKKIICFPPVQLFLYNLTQNHITAPTHSDNRFFQMYNMITSFHMLNNKNQPAILSCPPDRNR